MAIVNKLRLITHQSIAPERWADEERLTILYFSKDIIETFILGLLYKSFVLPRQYFLENTTHLYKDLAVAIALCQHCYLSTCRTFKIAPPARLIKCI